MNNSFKTTHCSVNIVLHVDKIFLQLFFFCYAFYFVYNTSPTLLKSIAIELIYLNTKTKLHGHTL